MAPAIAIEDVRPTADRVIVREDEPEAMTPGGLHLPDQAKKRPTQGVVVATGPGRLNERTGQREAMPVKPGDVVAYGKWSGVRLTECEEPGGPEIHLIRASELLAVIPAEHEPALAVVD